MSLRKKLIIGVLSTMILIIIATSIFSLAAIRTLSSHTETLTKGLSEDVHRDVTGFSEHYSGTLTFHEAENMQKLIETFLSQAKNQLNTIASFGELYSQNPGQMRNLFSKFQNENETIHSLFFMTNTNEIAVYPEGEQSQINQHLSNEDMYNKVSRIEKGKYYISQPFSQKNSSGYLLTVGMPLFQNNQFFGVLGVNLTLSELMGEIAETKIGNTGYVILTDHEGKILSYKDMDLAAKQENISSLPIFKEKTDDSVFLDLEQVIYLRTVEEQTGWHIYTVLPQEEVKSFTTAISQNMTKAIENGEKRLSELLTKTMIFQGAIVLFLLLLSAFISYRLANYFTKPIVKLANFIKRVASGDLTEKMTVKTRDEIGILFSSVNEMVDSLREITNKMMNLIHEMENGSHGLNKQAGIASDIAERVSAAMSDLSKGAEQLSSDMVDISNHIEDNNRFVQSMNGNIQKIGIHMTKAKTITEDGQSAMNNLNNKISSIVHQSAESSVIMNKLNEKLQAINEISELIYNISEQTNLLALNASIEAARAGEHGKGFAVVANEVKRLAEQSGNSVEKIGKLISEIQHDSRIALENIDKGKQYAEEGALMSTETEKNFQTVFRFIEHLAKDIGEIAAASDKLSASSQAIASSVESVVSISQETTAGVQEVTATSEKQRESALEVQTISEKLKEFSEELKESIDQFKLN